MASQKQWVQLDKHKLELSNLDKVLYPDEPITKAEVLEYYLNIAPTMLYHIKGRPLALIRYPDGITGEQFFQKNKPKWAPDWVESVLLGSEKEKDYVLANDQASLIWLANMAALEIHQMHSRKPHYNQPDYMVFDLDPPENGPFSKVIDIAFALKEHIEQYQYHVFVKTTGGKGVHLVVPLEPKADMSAVFKAAKEIAQPFVKENNDELTLHIKKKARRGRVLIDIYRNRTRQSIIAPYSLRGKPGAPVSMPVSWDELAKLESSKAYHLINAVEKVKTDGDEWEGMGGYATALHTERTVKAEPLFLETSPHRKTVEQLQEYSDKRDFSKTSEPGGGTITGEGNQFVVHRHHATRLHYDLRLEKEGVLQSWAVPKGLPPRPGIKRLAIQTEDHPLKYLTFEGKIPKGEYGGGDMWIYATGKYEVTKEKKGGLYFRLDSPAVSGEYRMHRTKEEEWLLEKVAHPQVDWINDPVAPMKAEKATNLPKGSYKYEVKWDGVRVLIALEDGQVRLNDEQNQDITDKFPELKTDKAFRAACGLFDAVIVYLDEEGTPSLDKVEERLSISDSTATLERSQSDPVNCYVFDCLYLDGRSIVKEPWHRRQEWLYDVIKKGTPYRISDSIEDGEGLLYAAREHNLSGIMAKNKEGPYRVGKRSDLWLDIDVNASQQQD